MKKLKRLLLVLTLVILFIFGINEITFADVGDFESYSSGGSSWDSGSSWSSSSSSYDRDYSSSSRHSSGSSYSDDDDISLGGLLGAIVILAVIFLIIKVLPNMTGNTKPMMNNINRMTEEEIENKIKEQDELFSKEEFLMWARDLYVKLQYAWSDRDWEVIRCFETENLFEQHSTQLKRYVENKQINKMERVSVNSAKLLDYSQSGDKELLSVVLNVKQVDYIIDENTEEIIKGDKNDKFRTYKLTFIRKTGVKTKAGEITVNTTNCPNCGAPTKITSAGKCEYCGSVITTGEFNWVLANLEPYNGI